MHLDVLGRQGFVRPYVGDVDAVGGQPEPAGGVRSATDCDRASGDQDVAVAVEATLRDDRSFDGHLPMDVTVEVGDRDVVRVRNAGCAADTVQQVGGESAQAAGVVCVSGAVSGAASSHDVSASAGKFGDHVAGLERAAVAAIEHDNDRGRWAVPHHPVDRLGVHRGGELAVGAGVAAAE
nr:hypothetical protein [Phytohabitans houttuyneae]